MRLLHTSDWHLGHTLKDVTREYEHQAFLAWLLEQIRVEQPDVVVITGDIFDSATPTAVAERMWFEWLAAARQLRTDLEIIAIAGNHDSPARFGAAASVLRELGVHVVGSLPRQGNELDLDRILIPVRGGVIAAVPFLRPVDLGPDQQLDDVYKAVVEEGLRRRGRGALVVLGHLYAAGADPSHLSERRISIGGQESAPIRMFPPEIDYVALGHMHRAQRVLRENIRYAGAPIALALDEASYSHQILIVDLPGEIRSVRVPQQIDIVRIPARGAASLNDALDAIAKLPARLDGDDPVRPYLDLMIALDKPEPRLRAILEQALEGKRPRLVQLRVEHTGTGDALADRIAKRLAELDPRDVFLQLWSRDHAEPPSAAVVAAFDRLLAEVRGDLADPGKPKRQLELL